MAKNKTLPAIAGGGQPQPPSKQNQPLNVSALSQQLEQVSIEQNRHTSSPKRPSPSRKSKSDNITVHSTGSGSDIPQSRTKNKRSPKANNVNGVKPQTPSRPTSIPPGPPPNTLVQPNGVMPDLASHYAGPTFHSSPAPSSLPMPSFFAAKNLRTAANFELESPPDQSTPIKSIRSVDSKEFDDSPLAPFFKADREEKNRLRNKYSTDSGVFGSPTLRPSSAGGLPEHYTLRSESPLSWDSPRKVNGRFDMKNHSTSELPFQMDSEFDSPHPPRKQFAQRFRASTEQPQEYNPKEYRPGISGRNNCNHVITRGENGLQVTPRRQPVTSDLESSTRTLKNLLSIKSQSTESHSSLSLDGPPSPSPIQHHRTRSAAQPPIRNITPSHSSMQVPRRVVSTSGVSGINHSNPPSQFPPVPVKETISEDDTTLKMEMELRKVLNLS